MKTRSLYMTAIGLVIAFALLFASGVSSDAAVIGNGNSTEVQPDQNAAFDLSGVPKLAYTVDFEYADPETGKTNRYSLAGAGSIALKDLAVRLGITDGSGADAFAENVKEAAFSDETLVEVRKDPSGEWELRSLRPFHTEEQLVITMRDGTLFRIKANDVAESSDLTNFLVNAVINGAVQNDDGEYMVEEGKPYSFMLVFHENSHYQFANHQTLTYQIPAGIRILEDQTGPLEIYITYNGRTYQVDATYDLDTNGRLEVKFDERDPDFHELAEATDVTFRYIYHAEFDGTNTKIKFSDTIERDIVFQDPEPGQAYAEKTATYDEKTGTFHYTITVHADGDVEDVRVRDNVTGNVLVVDTNSLTMSGNSTTPTGGISSSGFDYTFPAMHDGEVITIQYDAHVDFSLDPGQDGTITPDQTKNTVTIKPKDGDPHNSEYSREITYKGTKKSDGHEAGTTETGDKIIDWSIEYNPLALVAVGGDRITDRIAAEAQQYMKYYGNGITVKAYDKTGALQYSASVPYADLTSHSDSSWTYTIPAGHTSPWRYVITYQTVVDMAEVSGDGTGVTLSNTANDDEGSVDVSPDDEIAVDKEAESYSTQEVSWKTTLKVPADGLTRAVVTDTLPARWFDGLTHYDFMKNGSLEITGLLPGESYAVDTSTTGVVKITFFRDAAQQQPGLLPSSGGRSVYVRLKTVVDQEWLRKGYQEGFEYLESHVNSIDFNGVPDTATVTYGKPGIKKEGVTEDGRSFRFDVIVDGLDYEPFTIDDVFDEDLLEIDTSKVDYPEHMAIYGGDTEWSQIFGRRPVNYRDTSTGIAITANTVPKHANGTYYPFYRISYYLRLKEGVDLEDLAVANGGEYTLKNKAVWGDYDYTYEYKVKYDYLDKQLLNKGELGGRNRKAQYKIVFNPAKATLNDGQPMKMTDVMSANLSLDYGSVRITTDPAGIRVPYTISGGKDEHGEPDGTTVATYTVPDATRVEIIYDADVRGDGGQTISNKVSILDDEETEEEYDDFGDAEEGEGAVSSFRIIKVDAHDASKKLKGVKFKIFAENPELDFGEEAGYAKEIVLETDKDGEIEFDGDHMLFYFDEVYHVQEVEAHEDYGLIDFDYLITLTDDMAKVNYQRYIYYYSDSMQIKNEPLEGLVVEKQVDSEEEEDLTRKYRFRVSILKEDGTVDTDYNEKNGDDQFVNGSVEFELKHKQQKMFWGFRRGTAYKVEELDADGFATSVKYDVFDEDGNIIETRNEETTSHVGQLTQPDEVLVFTNSKRHEVGKLKIKKNVTVNGKTTTSRKADGTYWFDITGPDGYAATKTITVVNGVSNEVTVQDLEPGTYTVHEDTTKNPAGMSLVGNNDVQVEVEAGASAQVRTAVFTNNKTEVGKLKIKKNVTVNGKATTSTKADGTYTFDITGPDGYEAEKTITITNGVSNEITVEDLVPGTYTVSEDRSKNPAGMFLIGENDIEVEVEAGAEAQVRTAEFTNNKTEVGKLKIKKNVTVNGKATTSTKADGTYTFVITGPEDYEAEKTITITNGVSSEVTVEGLEPGTYTVHEDTSKNPAGMSLTGNNDIEVEVEAGAEAEVKTAEFTNNKVERGKLKIKKNVTVNGKTTTGTKADGTYTFVITGPDDYEETKTITITNGVSNEITVEDLVPGTYLVREDTSKNPAGMSLIGNNNLQVEVEGGAEAEIRTAEFTNNKSEKGKLKIKKNVTYNGKATTTTKADGTYTFVITGPDDYEATKTITITNGVSNELTLDDLEPGAYTVHEDTTKNPAGMSLVGNNDIEVEVEAGEEAEVKTAAFTNNKVELGKLKIKKNVTVNGKATTGTKADGTYTFEITGPDDYEETRTITITNGVSNEVTVEDLEPGTYTVHEDTSKNPAGMVLIGNNDVEVEVEAGEEAEVKTATFTNNKTEVGKLKIKKNVTVNGKATASTKADGTYWFDVTGPDGYSAEKAIRITNGASNEVTVENLEPGTYTIHEDTTKNPNDMALIGENDIEVEVEAGAEAEVRTAAFTNNKVEVGKLKIRKNVTVNGKATTSTKADGTYTFYVIDEGGTTRATTTVKITNGVSNEATVVNLEPGRYTVREDTSKNPDGMFLVGGNDVEIEVEAGAEAEVKTASFTNNKTEVGGLKIKKNVTVNGKATTTTKADGTYWFNITGPDDYEATKKLTITNGASDTLTVSGLEPGTYTVREDTSKNPAGMALIGDEEVEIEVEPGEEAEFKTAEFTNNKKDVGKLKIRKNVTINGKATTTTNADGDYTFEITGPDGYSATKTITVTNGQSNEVTVEDLVPGTYTIHEDTSENPDGMSLIGDNDKEIEVEAGAEARVRTAAFTNNKVEVGSLKIRKYVTVNGKTTTGTKADGTYTFVITGPDEYEETKTITITNGVSNEITVSDLIPGVYTVSEDTSKNPDGMALIGDKDVEITVEAGAEARVRTAAFTNNKKEVGKLKIKKNVTVNGKATTTSKADGTYTFDITGPDDYEATKTLTITNGASKEITVSDLVPGTYTVSEDTSKNPDGMALIGDKDVEVEVEAGAEAEVRTAEFTNNKKEVGKLKIKKNVTVNGKATTGTAADGTYTFEITGPDDYEATKKLTVTDGASSEVTVDDLKPGVYTVHEDTSKNPEGMSLIGENDKEIEVEGGAEAEVRTAAFTNNKVEVGSLKIKKNVTVEGKATTGTEADGTYTFKVKDADGALVVTTTVTITNGRSEEVTVADLEPGTYTVSEDTSKNPDRMILVGENDVKIKVEAGETAAVRTAEFTNDRAKEIGSLRIRKNVTVNGEATTSTHADGIYKFDIRDGEGDLKATTNLRITNGKSNIAQVNNLKPGRYTVSEDTSRNPARMTLVGENDIEVEVKPGETAHIETAEFTNDRKVAAGSLKIRKNVTVNGEATTGTRADGTYTFQVKDAAGAVKATARVTVKNGKSSTARVDNLDPGTYTVHEDTSKNPARMKLVGENDVEVKVEAGADAEIGTAAFTNDYNTTSPPLGEGEILVAKELEGRAWEDGDAFTFGLVGSAGAPMPDKTSITITNDDAGHAKSFGKIEFSEAGKYVYFVKEIRGSIDGVKYDSKWHKVVLDVVEDGEGNFVARNGAPLVKTVEITNTYKPPTNPRTGDTAGLLALVGMLIAAVMTLVLMVIYRRARSAGRR